MLYKVFLTQKHFYFLRKYKLQVKTHYLNILLSTSYYDTHKTSGVQRDVLVSWLSFNIRFFQLQNILKKPKQYITRFTKAHFVSEM